MLIASDIIALFLLTRIIVRWDAGLVLTLLMSFCREVRQIFGK